jgi:hypothetical protein
MPNERVRTASESTHDVLQLVVFPLHVEKVQRACEVERKRYKPIKYVFHWDLVIKRVSTYHALQKDER